MKPYYDLIIIGGGPAGMSAALYAKRQGIKFLLITETLGGLTNFVPSLRSYLGYHYITGFNLIKRFKSHLEEQNIEVVEDKVVKVYVQGSSFIVKTRDDSYPTKTVLVATGRRFRHLGITGEKEFTGKGVSDCAACDGPLFKGKTVAVIGGGRSGLFATLFLLNIAKKIYLIEKDDSLKTSGGLSRVGETIRENPKVEILLNAEPKEIQGDQKVEAVVLDKDGKEERLAVTGVFVEIGYDPNTEFIRHLVKTNDRGEIIIDEECKSSTPGIFAAGDVTQLKEKQVVVSVGDGAKAALAIVIYLEQTKTRKKRE